MSNSTIAFAVLGLFVAAWLFFGYISGVGKTFKGSGEITSSAQTRARQEETIQETQRKHRELMDDMRQKISDGTRKH